MLYYCWIFSFVYWVLDGIGGMFLINVLRYVFSNIGMLYLVMIWGVKLLRFFGVLFDDRLR